MLAFLLPLASKVISDAVAKIPTTPGERYFVRIDGTGENAPPTVYSDYGSLGQYAVSVSEHITPVTPPKPEPPHQSVTRV